GDHPPAVADLTGDVSQFVAVVLGHGDEVKRGRAAPEPHLTGELQVHVGGIYPADAVWKASPMGLFDPDEARAELAPDGRPTPLGGLPEWKAATARLDELLTAVQQTGAELKGLAPLLVDFPAELAGVPVFLCWLEC